MNRPGFDAASNPGRFTTVISKAQTKWGQMHGDVSVATGGRLRLWGFVHGTLTIQSGGQARIWGTVSGLVVESGGSAKLKGMCLGDAGNPGRLP